MCWVHNTQLSRVARPYWSGYARLSGQREARCIILGKLSMGATWHYEAVLDLVFCKVSHLHDLAMELFHVSDATVFMKHGKNHPIGTDVF